jgi:hypothetical protein
VPDFLRGKAGMDQSQSRQDSNPFPGFVRSLIWTKDKEEKFLLFLNHASDMPTVEYHGFVPVGTWKSGKPRYEEFIARTDPGVGESSDELNDRLGKKPALRSMAVAVELEPTYTTVQGRKRPTGFAVKTETFERKDEQGKVEEVEAPILGMVVQSPRNFFGWVGSFDESTAPIEETPVQIIRRGKDANTAYDFTPYLDQTVDFTNLIDYIGNMSYLRGSMDDIDLTDEPKKVALAIGDHMLNKRLSELTDKERYDRLVGPIDHIEDRFGSDQKPAERPQRPPQRTNPPSFDEMVPPAADDSSKFEELRRQHEQTPA